MSTFFSFSYLIFSVMFLYLIFTSIFCPIFIYIFLYLNLIFVFARLVSVFVYFVSDCNSMFFVYTLFVLIELVTRISISISAEYV